MGEGSAGMGLGGLKELGLNKGQNTLKIASRSQKTEGQAIRLRGFLQVTWQLRP